MLFYLLFLVEALLVTVWDAKTSGVENVCNLEAAQNALDLSPTGTLQMKGAVMMFSPTLKPGVLVHFSCYSSHRVETSNRFN